MNGMDFDTTMDNFLKERDKTIRRILGKFIKGNFLIEIEHRVIAQFPNLLRYYDFQMSMEKLVVGSDANYDFDICKLIVGCHGSNTIFLSDDERIKLERSSAYREQLVTQVIEHIKMRPYGSFFFRSTPVMQGELFAYYSTPYDLFVISMRMNELLATQQTNPAFIYLYRAISTKALVALTLLEDNLLDNCYPICRTIIELYLKLLILKKNPNIIKEYNEFAEFEIRQSCCEQEYPAEFNELFQKRRNKDKPKKIDYLHYGWVDYISDYHSVVAKQPYSINGILDYLQMNDDNVEYLNHIEILYKMCHGYVHGNVISSRYPLLHYFEISSMLYYTVFNTYNMICSELGNDGKINGVDIMEKVQSDFRVLDNQYRQRSTEQFENYYKRFR